MAALKVAHPLDDRTTCTANLDAARGAPQAVNGLVFYIGLGLGLALAAGVRPFLPALLAGALASAKALGVTFGAGDFHFLQSGWWLLAVALALVLAYGAQMALGLDPALDPNDRARRRNDPLAASLTGLAFGAGGLLFAGTLAAHHDASWPGVLAGFAAVALSQRVCAPLVVRTRARLSDRGAREAVTLYLDAAALLLAALTALLHPLGYVAVALFAWMWLRTRGRSREKHAGLRILRR
jgi:hypothetical protein